MSGFGRREDAIRTALDPIRFLNELRSTEEGRSFLDGETDSVRVTRSFLDREAEVARRAMEALDEILQAGS